MTRVRLALAALAVLLATPAIAFEDAARPEAMIAALVQGSPAAQGRVHIEPEYPIRLRGSYVAALIERETCARIGCGWTSTALRIAKLESGFRCNARNRRAVGLFQNTRPEAFGVSRAAALTCEGGVRAGVAHMAMCVAKGARNAAQMMRCHNSGHPHGRVDRVYRLALAGAR